MGDRVGTANDRKKAETDNAPKTTDKPVRQQSEPADNIGNALRAVYHETIDEAVPDEMLDLLRKLG